MRRLLRRISAVLALAMLAGLLGTVRTTAAPKPSEEAEPEVFASAPQPDGAKYKRDATTKRIRYVDPDLSLFPSPSRGTVHKNLKLNLFDDVKHTAVLTKAADLEPGVVSWNGHLKGVPGSDANFVVQDGSVMSGSVRKPGAVYQVRWASSDAHAILEFDESGLPPEHPREHPHGAYPSTEPKRSAQGGDALANDSASQIDFMAIYTDDARAAAGGTAQIQSTIQLAVQNTNASYANSGVVQRLNLVHQAEVAYNETGNMGTDLNCVTNTSDNCLDSIHTLRNTHKADVVTFITETGGGCGLGWVMTTISSTFASNAFNVTLRTCAAGNLSMAHELGHNMGLQHDRYVDNANGAHAYSHGFVDPTAPRTWRTVMAYNDLCADNGTNCTRLQYFSNPAKTFDGSAMGIAEGQANSADATKSLNNTAQTVANFRDGDDACTDDALEPNDARTSATTMSNGLTRNGKICANNEDYFSATATAGQTITFDLDFAHASGDLDMALQNSGGTQVALSQSSNDDEQIVYQAPTSGTYYLRVFGYLGAANTYGLTLGVSGGPVGCTDDAFEQNDTKETATSIAAAQTRSGKACPDDHDFFSYAATANQIITADLDFVHATGDLDMRLRNAAGTVVKLAESEDDDERITYAIPSTGTYYLEVYGFDDASNSYALTLGVVQGFPVAVSNGGKGSIKGPGIICGTDCREIRAAGTSVALTARAARGSKFVKWTGACAGAGRVCTRTVNGPLTSMAVFKRA